MVPSRDDHGHLVKYDLKVDQSDYGVKILMG